MTAASDLVRDVLNEYGSLSRGALSAFLAQQTERDAVYRLAAEYPLRKGRSLRASLCIAAARAFGATVEEAVRSAVSLELLHSAFLVHDDIEDESEERRGKPTLHNLVGVASALNAGDALITLALRPLLGNRSLLGPLVAWQILEEAERMVRESVEGQAMELRWRQECAFLLTESDYLMMVLKKTCWYTTLYPIRVGALIGTRGNSELDQFARFGFFLGAAFQIQDDLLNIVGDHAQYGKEIAGDLLEGKRTLLLIHTLQHLEPAARARAIDLLALSRREKPASEVAWLGREMRQAGSIEYASQVAHAFAGAAAHEFGVCFRGAAPGRDLDFVEALPHWVLERS